ncbi:DUF6160 family protein [Alkalimarinus sediminis]|uniref:DUF6160 family protein n=1 Tax=Alkalimarinus sediminis TaxID=1632866 RepID=A0A9E8HKJ7_9ALTE|nr:DUF6160 family protein [Alkalimarinus sediminis]UZW76030.1 DUF6160 family protein [Alkalimarinus sediminis]
MKGLNKIALVTAISAASFGANAELKSLDDSAMGELTGQAGITIELETKVDIGSVVYTDTASAAGSTNMIGGGSLAMNGISIGGRGGSKLDDLQIDIDLADDGDAIIDVHSQSGVPIDFGITMASASLQGSGTVTAANSTLLASNINIEGDLYKLGIQVDTATDVLGITAAFTVTDFDVDVDFLSLGIQNLTISSDNSNTCGAGDVACQTAQGISAGINSEIATGPLAGSSYGNAAVAIMTVGKGVSGVTGSTQEGLAMGIEYFEADIDMGVTLGGVSIGTVAINDLVITGTEMLVYGH